MRYANVKVHSGKDSWSLRCNQCEGSKQNRLQLQQLHHFKEVCVVAFYCSKHDDEFAYVNDNDEIVYLNDKSKLSKSERERILIDLEQSKSLAQDIHDKILRDAKEDND